MIKKDDIQRIHNILLLNNKDIDVSYLENILTAVKQEDIIKLIDAIYTHDEIDTLLIKNVINAAKNKDIIKLIDAIYPNHDEIDISLFKDFIISARNNDIIKIIDIIYPIHEANVLVLKNVLNSAKNKDVVKLIDAIYSPYDDVDISLLKNVLSATMNGDLIKLIDDIDPLHSDFDTSLLKDILTAMKHKDIIKLIDTISPLHNELDTTFLKDVMTAVKKEDTIKLIDAINSHYDKVDMSLLKDVLTALKHQDTIKLIDAIYSSHNAIDTSLLKNVYQTIKINPDLEDDLLDSFSSNQVASKSALLKVVDNLNMLDKNSTVAIWGSWYGSIFIPMLADKVKKIICIDIDNEPLQIAKNKLFKNYKNVDYVCTDIFDKCLKSYLDTNLIINTSCEHMPPMKEWKWFGPGAIKEDNKSGKEPKLSSNCYFVFQSNNMFGIEGHINCVNSIDEFKEQLPQRAEVLYEEEVEDTRGTRYMLVGKFMPL